MDLAWFKSILLWTNHAIRQGKHWLLYENLVENKWFGWNCRITLIHTLDFWAGPPSPSSVAHRHPLLVFQILRAPVLPKSRYLGHSSVFGPVRIQIRQVFSCFYHKTWTSSYIWITGYILYYSYIVSVRLSRKEHQTGIPSSKRKAYNLTNLTDLIFRISMVCPRIVGVLRSVRPRVWASSFAIQSGEEQRSI